MKLDPGHTALILISIETGSIDLTIGPAHHDYRLYFFFDQLYEISYQNSWLIILLKLKKR